MLKSSKDIEQLNKTYNITKKEDKMQILSEEFEKLKKVYDEIVNKISENMYL